MEYNIRYTLDNQLKEYYKELQEYLIKSGYFDSSEEDMKKKYKTRIDGIEEGDVFGETGIQNIETPARRVITTTKKDYGIRCPLCITPQAEKLIHPYNLEKLLLWRGYMIKSNTFPYFRTHYLIQSSDHNEEKKRGTQDDVHNNPVIINDMLDFIELMGKGTMLFNGWVGNSLAHLHFHYTESHFPIKTKIKEYKLEKENMKLDGDSISINIYRDEEHNCKNFVMIKGKNIGMHTYKFLRYLEDEKLFYNLVFYYNEGNHYMFIFIRKKGKDDLDLNFGAAHFAGIGIFNDMCVKLYRENKEKIVKSIEEYCKNTLIKFDQKHIHEIFH